MTTSTSLRLAALAAVAVTAGALTSGAEAQSGSQPTYRLGTGFDRIGDSHGGRGEDLDAVQASFESARGIASARVRASAGRLSGTVVVSFGRLTPTGCDVSSGASVTFPAGEDVAQWRVAGSSQVTTLETDPRSATVESALVGPSGTLRPDLVGRPLDCAAAVLTDPAASPTTLDAVAGFALPLVALGAGSGGSDAAPAPTDRGSNPRLALTSARATGEGYGVRVAARSSRSGTYTIAMTVRARGTTALVRGTVVLRAGVTRRIVLRPSAARARALRRAGARSPAARIVLVGHGSTAARSAHARSS